MDLPVLPRPSLTARGFEEGLKLSSPPPISAPKNEAAA